VWANLTIKNVPQPVLRRLEARATLHRRSLNLNVIACLESLVQSSPLDVDALLVRVREIRRTSRWPRTCACHSSPLIDRSWLHFHRRRSHLPISLAEQYGEGADGISPPAPCAV
jgi:antitoxin FitA